MSTSKFPRRPLSERSPYHLDEFREREIIYFCLQYPGWRKKLNHYKLLRSQGEWSDPVGDEAVLRVMIQKMHNRLEVLPPRERRLLMYRYGIESLEYKTIAETAAFFHLTQKYLRIIEARALDKLREGMNDGKIL